MQKRFGGPAIKRRWRRDRELDGQIQRKGSEGMKRGFGIYI